MAVTVWVKPGQSFSRTLEELQDLGLVQQPKKFRWLAFLRGDERRIRAGEYVLRTSMPPGDILDALIQGNILLRKVVIPEGSTLRMIAELLEKVELVSQEAFIEAAYDRRLMEALGVSGDSFEGYLFPETYYFAKGVTPRQIIRKMVGQFHSVVTPLWTEQAKAMGLSVHELVTLASVVEKETARPEERSLVAAVFVNRLKRGMPLESDPTVIYGMKDFDGNLTRKDLATFSLYNTYLIAGLPAGPIANPGKASIEAVVYPAEEPYLYFVSRNDGSHHFSRTLAEHNAMVDRYQRGRSNVP